MCYFSPQQQPLSPQDIIINTAVHNRGKASSRRSKSPASSDGTANESRNMAPGWIGKLCNGVVDKVRNHPKTTRIVTGVIGGAVTGPLLAPAALGIVGFGAAGPIAGSIAAGVQAGIGNVAAGSLFAVCQSAAMGGGGASIIGAISASSGALLGAVAGGSANLLIDDGGNDADREEDKEAEPDHDNDQQKE